MGRSIFPTLYVIIGVVLAFNNGYAAFSSISTFLSFILAILLWPLLLIGINLHISLGI